MLWSICEINYLYFGKFNIFVITNIHMSIKKSVGQKTISIIDNLHFLKNEKV